jgi:hypothetical protein
MGVNEKKILKRGGGRGIMFLSKGGAMTKLFTTSTRHLAKPVGNKYGPRFNHRREQFEIAHLNIDMFGYNLAQLTSFL